MTEYTITVEDKSLESFVVSLFQSLENLPHIRVARQGNSFVVRSDQSAEADVSVLFEALFTRWKKETLLSSNGDEIIGHPAYREMIALGQPAVPLMLMKLRDDPYFLFDALTAIKGEDPVRVGHEGQLRRMAEDWLEWGKN